MSTKPCEEYFINNQLSFILTDKKIIVKTVLQTNLVTYPNGNYKRQWERLQDKIRTNEIKSIEALLEYNRPRIVGHQIQGLLLIPTVLARHV